MFAAKKNLRLLTTDGLPNTREGGLTYRQVAGGMLVQDKDNGYVGKDDLKVVTKVKPTAEQMAEIALATAENARLLLESEPRVAMLSFSTNGSAKHPKVSKVQQATELVKDRDASLLIDGEIQLHTAIQPKIARLKVVDSQLDGRTNVFIFPSLESGNVAYKMAEHVAGARAIGPFLQGLNKPANDLSRSCSVDDIYYTIATTAVQAAGR